MKEQVTVRKPFRYGLRVFEVGEVGEVVEVESPLTFDGRPIYDFYVKFQGHKPVGVRGSEVERGQALPRQNK